MVTRKPPETEPLHAISASADDWIRQFVERFEREFLDASRMLTEGTTISDLQVATVRAILATFVDSGLEFESILELFGQVAVESQSTDVTWSDALNLRRFALIDKKIQGALTPSESIELAGLTRIMRNQIDTEFNLPMKGAQSLHLKLLQLDSRDQPD